MQPIQRLTSTGISLTLVHSDSNIVSSPVRGQLTLVNADFDPDYAILKLKREINVSMNEKWNAIYDLLSFDQYRKVSKNSLKYVDLAKEALKVSKKRRIQELAKEILELDAKLSQYGTAS